MIFPDSHIWEQEFFGNNIAAYFIALLVFIGIVLAFKIGQWLVLKWLEHLITRTKTELDDALIEVVKTIKPPFYWYVAFYVALQYLTIHGGAQLFVKVILIAWLVYEIVRALQIFIDVYVRERLAKTDDKSKETVVHIIHNLSSILLWTLGLLFVLQNVGVNITSLIAGLGIGGLALALAAQNILSDLFSSLAIYFDKPFEPGDFIQVGKHKGTVKRVGIKTTRIKSIAGEEIVISNNDLTSSTLQNFGRLNERRAIFTIGVTYETSAEKLRLIPDLIKNVIEKHDTLRFDRVHFKEFADWSLNFEVVYHVKNRDYKEYMSANQDILYAIHSEFEEKGIDMAYPTKTVILRQEKS